MEEFSNTGEGKFKKVYVNSEIARIKKLEGFELEQEDLLRYKEHLSRSEKGYLTAVEAVDFYEQFIPFLIRELEKKKLALDNMRSEKKDLSSIFASPTKAPGRTVPQDIKDWLKKLEDMGASGQELDKMKKLLFQRDASGRLVKSVPELYALISEFSVNEAARINSELEKIDMDKKSVKFAKVASLGTDESNLRTIPPDIDEKLKQLETTDIEPARISEFKKKILRKKPTGEFVLSHKEFIIRLMEFYEQELRRSKARWLRDKKLEETLDNASTKFTSEGPSHMATDGPLKVFPSDILERMQKLEEYKVNSDNLNMLKTDLLKRNSNGNLIYSHQTLYNKLIDFYENILKERCKELELIAQFEERSRSGETQEVISSNKEIEEIRQEVERKEKLASEYFARSQRLEMDIKRMKDRKDKALDELKNKSNEKLLGKLLLVLDDFERAIEASSKGADKAIMEGIQLINRRLISVLQREGLKPIESLPGTDFDPKIHEAFEQVESEQPEDTIVAILRQGYWLGSKLLRPSLVTVSRGLSKGT
ncbi:MAG TPA: nucleotide exchange factor GrpE [Candidatus Eremiobacteraeota bacterium]|nr:nucleotide exchange factor GrpE [Candidatus Eremiobacteraeota bacterium]